MNEIDLLKRVRHDVPAPDPLELARARQRLQSRTPVRPRAAGRRRVLVAGAVAATLAAGFLVNDVVTRDGGTAPGAVADASTFLAAAAEHASADRDTPIPAGQYRQITQRKQDTWNFGPANSYHGTKLDVSNWWLGASLKPPYTATSVLGAKQEFSSAAAAKFWATADPLNVKPQSIKSADVCGVGLIGGFLGFQKKGSKYVCTPSWLSPSPDFLSRLPRDPGKLLAALRKQDGQWPGLDGSAQHADQRAFQRLTVILTSGIPSADLRAALYRAARLIPGIRLRDDVVNLDGRNGRAIGLVQQFGIRTDLIIDSRTGQYVGLREVATVTAPLNGDGDPMPIKRGDVITWTSVSTKITPTRPAV